MDKYKYFLFPDSESNSFSLALNNNLSIISSALIDLIIINQHNFRFYKIYENGHTHSKNQFLIRNGKNSLFYFELFLKAKAIDQRIYYLVYRCLEDTMSEDIVNERIIEFYKESAFKNETLLCVVFFMLSIDKVSMAIKLIDLANQSFSEVDLSNWRKKILFAYSYNHKLMSDLYSGNLDFLIKKGNELYSNNSYKESIYYFEKVIYLHGNNKFLLKLGLAYRHIGDNYKAINVFNNYIRLNPEHHTGYYLRGLVSLTMMRYREALSYYEISISKHPSNKNCVFKSSVSTLKKILRNKNSKIEELPIYQNLRLKSIIEYANLHLTVSNIHYSLGEIEEASYSLYKVATGYRPDAYPAYEKLLEVDYELFLKAVERLDLYLSIINKTNLFKFNNVNSDRLRKYAQTLYVTRGRIDMLQLNRESAEYHLKAGIKIHSNIKAREWLAYLYLWSQRYDESLNLYTTILDEKPFRVSVIVNIVRVYLEQNELPKAGEYLKKYHQLLTKEKNKDKTHLVRRNYLYAIGDIRGAWLVFRDRKICTVLNNERHVNYTHNIFNAHLYNKNILILAEWGPGDELRWASVYSELGSKFSNLYIGCDPRLKRLFSASFPSINFIPINKRIRGAVKSDQVKYLSKVPQVLLTQVLDNTSYGLARNMDAVTLISDVLGEIRDSKQAFTVHEGLLLTGKNQNSDLNEWLSKLPKDNINIGICWKSGLVDVARSIHYSDLNLWEKVFKLEDVNFINLQYSGYEDDINSARQEWDVEIYTPPINLKDDFDGVAVLMKNMDLVISPATTVVELAGMLGVNALLFSNSPEIDWRVKNDGSDLWHSSIKHIKATRNKGYKIAQESIVNQIYSHIISLVDKGSTTTSKNSTSRD